MRAGRQYTPLIYNTAAALVGATVAFVLLRATTLDSWISKDPVSPGSIASNVARPADRLPSEPLEAISPDAAPLLAPSWRLSVMPRSTRTESWSTEIQPVAPAPQLVRRASIDPKTARARPSTSKKARPRRNRHSATLKSRLAEIAPAANARLASKFRAVGAAWPPADIAFVAIKDERILQLYARPKGGTWQFIYRYRVLAASGGAGPKLRQGDRQVPEGVYRIVYLNPRSAYHVSLRVNYPNAFDRKMARSEKRRKLGGDIMIHGKRSSAGCLAMGDEAIEELFVLAARTGYSKVKLIIAPTDFRVNDRPVFKPGQPKWLPQLYTQIAAAMTEFKAPRAPGLLSFFTQ